MRGSFATVVRRGCAVVRRGGAELYMTGYDLWLLVDRTAASNLEVDCALALGP